MTLQEFDNLLKTTGLDVAYGSFPETEAPTMPFICYMEIAPNNFSADGKVYYSQTMVEVQLFTSNKDIETEKLVESTLSQFFWTKELEIDDDERCYRTVYRLEI